MKKCMKFIKTALLLCALLLTVTAITAKAEESYGFRVTRSVPNPEIGTEVTITFELTDYDETKTGIRGLQVDLAGLDPQILEVVSAASLVADDGAMTN